ncbi:MAG: hypothetical protein KJO43_04260 [Phycisphaerae bacterium]|nr:hypothetical protein [Phycisphaerae bacterium]NNF43124.1 hypothetical protein [Phycisphaerales bacterium]
MPTLRLVVLMLLLSTVRVEASSPAMLIDPWAPRAIYDRLIDRLGLDADRRVVAEVLYEDYAADVADLGARVAEHAAAAGQAKVQDALAGRVLVPADELREMRVSVAAAERSVWPEADRLFSELRFNTASLMLSGETGVTGALAAFDRAVYGAPRRRDRSEPWYAGDGVDVIALLAAARRRGGELATLDLAGGEERIAAYEAALVTFLTETAAADRAARLERRIAKIERDRDRLTEIDRDAVVRWRRLHTLNEAMITVIAEMAAAQLGPSAATAWRERFDRACFPTLFATPRVEHEAAWILRHDRRADVRAQVERILAGDRSERARLLAATMRLQRSARQVGGLLLYAGIDPARLGDPASRLSHQELLKISGARAQLDATTSAAFAALLTERQRKQMRADLAAAATRRG